MIRNRKVWLVCGAAMGLPLSTLAQNIRQVQVSEVKGGVEIRVTGENLQAPVNIHWPKEDGFTLEWDAALASPGGRIRVDSGTVKSVWYGWYAAHPHRVRVQVRSSSDVAPLIRQEAGAWVVFAGAHQANPEPAVASKAVAPSYAMQPNGLLAAVLNPASGAKNPVAQKAELPIERPHSILRSALGSSIAVRPEMAPAAMNSAPVVTLTPELKKWATLEKLEKSQVSKPLIKTQPKPVALVAASLDAQPQAGYRRVTVDCSNADLAQILKGLALQSGANIVIGPAAVGKVTADLHDVTIDQALKYIAYLTNVRYEVKDGIYMFGVVTSPNEAMSLHAGPVVTRAVFIRSEQEGKIVLLLTTQFTGSGLAVLSSEKTESKSDHAPDANNPANFSSLLTSESITLGRHFLLMVGPSSVVDQAVAMANSLDQDLMQGYDAAEASMEMVTYDVKYADPRALREALISQVQGLRAVVGPNSVGTFDTYKEGKQKTQATEQVTQADVGLGAQPGGTNAASSSPVGTVGSVNTTSVDDTSLEAPFAKEEGFSVPMRLVLRGTHPQILQALEFVKALDVAPKQVALELRVMELSKTDALNAGIDWSITSGGIVKVLNLNNSQSTPTNAIRLGMSGGGFNGNVTASLDALASKNRLVARPNLVAMDGRQSEVFIGDIIRYIESITQSQNGTTVTTGEVPVGVRLSVLPRIGADGNMTLELRPRVSLLTSFTAVPGGGQLPQTSSRLAQSTISLQSGQTIAIGGLIQDQDVKSMSGIPILMNLPIIGNLFKSTTISKERTELVIFLTAKVINGPVGSEDLPMFRDVQDKASMNKG